MAFGSKQPTFRASPYGYKRRNRRIPRWLILLTTGIVIGAGGVIFLQRSYGPQRLTVEQSEQLRMDLNSANIENQRLIGENKKGQDQLTENTAEIASLNQKIASLQQSSQEIQQGVSSLINAIPPDPRGSNPGIRSAEMVLKEDGLHYSALLIQDAADSSSSIEDMPVKIKFVAIGTYRNGNTGYIDIGEHELSLGLYKLVQGQGELPNGYKVRQVTIQVMADDTNKVIATRTIRVVAG